MTRPDAPSPSRPDDSIDRRAAARFPAGVIEGFYGRLQARVEQLRRAGCGHFALLFNDIPASSEGAGIGRFGSLAAAQSHVANALCRWVRQHRPQARFMLNYVPLRTLGWFLNGDRRDPRVARLRAFCAGLSELRDHPLFHALNRPAWALREEIDLLGRVEGGPERITSDFHLPGTYRGGIVPRLQALLVPQPDGTVLPAKMHPLMPAVHGVTVAITRHD